MKIIKSGIYLEYDLKQNDRYKHFFLINSENVPLLSSTNSDVDAKIGKWKNKAGIFSSSSTTSKILSHCVKVLVYKKNYYSINSRKEF